jgi:hypothetical protein
MAVRLSRVTLPILSVFDGRRPKVTRIPRLPDHLETRNVLLAAKTLALTIGQAVRRTRKTVTWAASVEKNRKRQVLVARVGV